MKLDEMKKEVRTINPIGTNFTTRDEENNPIIEGYFVRFDDTYEIADGLTESISPNAFDNTLGGDIRALTDHDTTLVLGRTTNGTLHLSVDEHGLYGVVAINPKDSEAMNLYERVKRGDVSQCSFGFEIVRERSEAKPNNEVHWTIEEVNLFEVSAVTFPAYQSTSISARCDEAKEILSRENEAWKLQMKAKLKGKVENGIESIDD